MLHDRRSTGARAYMNLAREIIQVESSQQAGAA
jgi:hypothetical protein